MFFIFIWMPIIEFVGDTTLEEQQHMFMLEEQGESHCFAAANQTELDEWLSSLRATINELRQNTLESSGSKITEENGTPCLFRILDLFFNLPF